MRRIIMLDVLVCDSETLFTQTHPAFTPLTLTETSEWRQQTGQERC